MDLIYKYKLQLMGSICQKTENQDNQYSMKALINQKGFDGLSLYFTTQNLSRIDSQCLLLYIDAKSKLRKNPFIQRASKTAANTIEDYYERQTNGNPLKPGECVILTISLTEFTFNKIVVLCLGVWGGSSHISEPLNKCLQNCFEEMKKANISSVAMTDYNEQFGIPLHVGQKCLVNAIYQKRSLFKVITIIFEKAQHQNEVIAAFERFKGSIIMDSQADKQSDYF